MVTVRDIEKALSIIRQVYEVIVVDTRAALSDDVLAFLDASDLILEVLAYDSMAIRALAMADEAFATIGYPPSKLEAVLNRSDSTGGFTKADVEEALNRKIEHEVVSDGKLVIAANNEGVPFVLANPDAPVSQGVRAMAASIAARLPGRMAALARH
jgi:pilus assembly protein CpaE